jgi:hypothetical protein
MNDTVLEKGPRKDELSDAAVQYVTLETTFDLVWSSFAAAMVRAKPYHAVEVVF